MKSKSIAPKTVGRPTDYLPIYNEQAEKLCRLGAIDADLADFFDVSEVTINAWKQAHPDFLKSIKRGKAEADRHIAQRLYDRAAGAEWIEQKEVKLKRKSTSYDDKGKKTEATEEEYVEIVDLKKAAPPDTTAIIFFLKNRRPDLWRDKQDIQHSVDKDSPSLITLKIDNG